MANKEIEKKARKIANKIISEMTYNVFYEIESAYERIIDKFYSDYAPKYYDRTFSIYKASNAYDDFSIGVKKKSEIGSVINYEVGIRVSSDNINGNPYSENKEDVFNRTFVKGFHGFAKDKDGSYVKTYPSPKEQMDEWFKEFKSDKKKIEKIKQDAIRRALK